VLTKPVPDTDGREKLSADGRLDRASATTVVNGNDEYAVECALKLVEACSEGGEVTLLSMAPPTAPDTLRKALAMGATGAVLVTDPALEGSCTLKTARVLAAALRTLEYDLVFAGADTSDGGGGIVAAAVASLLGLPYLSYAARVETVGGLVRVRRLTGQGYEEIEASMPALVVATQALGEPRYPSLRGIMSARQKPIRVMSLAEVDLGAETVREMAASSRVTSVRTRAPRAATHIVEGPPDEAAREAVAFLAERRLI
jgi:electron transfer flavoprotein beta subunit